MPFTGAQQPFTNPSTLFITILSILHLSIINFPTLPSINSSNHPPIFHHTLTYLLILPSIFPSTTFSSIPLSLFCPFLSPSINISTLSIYLPAIYPPTHPFIVLLPTHPLTYTPNHFIHPLIYLPIFVVVIFQTLYRGMFSLEEIG